MSTLFLTQSFSQSIDVNYYTTGAGNNFSLVYSHEFNKNEFGLGLGVNINSLTQYDDQSNFFYKRLFATKPIHNLNFNFTYDRKVFTSLKHIKPFIFYDLQVKYSTTRSKLVIPYSYDSTLVVNSPEEGILYREYLNFFGPFTWIENSIGFGWRVNINEKFYLKNKFGGGIYFIIGKDKRLAPNKYRFEFMWLTNFSLGYKF